MFNRRLILLVSSILVICGCIPLIIFGCATVPAPRVTVHTIPDGANVYINDKSYGESPIEVDVTPMKEHSIKAVKPGYRDAIKVIPENRLHQGMKETVILQLQPEQGLQQPLKPMTGTIEISSVPDGSEIWVNGKFVGQTPAQISLPAGEHTLVLKKNGYANWTRVINILQGSSSRIQAEFRPSSR